MHRRAAGVAALLAAGAVATPVLAQTPPAAEDPAPQRIEIKAEPASDTELRRREPVAKTIYGRDELDKYGDLSVTDVLKRLPGITLRDGSPRMRGMGAGYTRILINGEPAPPGFSLENLPPSQVERIEVSKGPTAEFSTQAVAGTINIILRDVARQRLREMRLALGYTVERAVPSVNGQIADRWGRLSMALPMSAYQWSGGSDVVTLRDTRDDAGAPQALRSVAQHRWRGGGVNFGPRLRWTVDDRWSIESRTFAQRNEYRNAGRAAIDVLLGSDPRSVSDVTSGVGRWQMVRTGLAATWRGPAGDRLEANVGVQASGNRFDNVGAGFDRAGVQSVDSLSSGRTSEQSRTTSGKYSRPLFDTHRATFGWDLESRRRTERRRVVDNGEDKLVGDDALPFRAGVERQALFAQDEWEIAPQWATYVGLRAERIATRSRNADSEIRNTSQVVTPLWHLNYRLDPKARDIVRASLTRSYRAPELPAMMARPNINTDYPANTTNPENAPDRVGNASLRPELSTGLDVAYEKYLAGGGVVSVGLFHRRIDGLIRNVLSRENVTWASVPRWVSRPVNLDGARSTGIELEVKGRSNELLPAGWWSPQGLSLRGALSAYRSRVSGLPEPYNRLEGQQPWSLTAGFDHAVAGWPLTWGGNIAISPAYRVQQTIEQQVAQGRSRSLDLYAMWTFNPAAVLRVGVNNLDAPDAMTDTRLVDSDGLVQNAAVRRSMPGSVNASLSLKF